MRKALRYLLVVALTAAVLLALAWGSVAPLDVARGDGAILRISLGARAERIEVCQQQTDEELARLAPQMRQSVICEGTTARYRLEVRRNGEMLHAQVVRGGGLRNDRPLYVSRDLPVPAGPAVFAVRLVRIDTLPLEQRSDTLRDDDDDDAADRGVEEGDVPRPGQMPPSRARRETDERRRRQEEAVPAELRLDLNLDLEPREVVVVSYDQRSRRLISLRVP